MVNDNFNKKIDIHELVSIAKKAGSAILDIYHSDNFEVELKSDNSPLTKADKISHQIIEKELNSLYPEIPLLSEEGREIPYEVRKSWEYFWLVDPLDGTKEFIKRNEEFTVNIALIHLDKPVAGVIYCPVEGVSYFSMRGMGAFKQEDDKKEIGISVSERKENLVAVKSRSHSSDEEEKIFSKYKVTDSLSKGSSLKFCMVAEGKADIYFRHGPTWEWDTAAGHAIVLEAGGSFDNKFNLIYNKEELLNPGFLCGGEIISIRTNHP